MCTLVPQGPVACCCHRMALSRMGLSLQGMGNRQHIHPTHRYMLRIFCHRFVPCQESLVCEPQRGRGGPVGTLGLGNDEVNNEVGDGTHGAFQVPVTKRYLLALPGFP